MNAGWLTVQVETPNLYLKIVFILKKRETNSSTYLLKIQTQLKPLTVEQPQFKHSLLLL